MAVLIRGCRRLTNRRFTADQVSFIHRRNVSPEERAFYGCKLTFGADVDEARFSPSTLNVPIVSADPYLNKLLIKYCEEALAYRRTNRNPYDTKVENAIAVLLPHGKAQMDEVARKLGMSRRTLTRRLASEGLTFTGVLNALRSDLAKRHLADNGCPFRK
jgi:AraC-like DNA-binding protein